MSILLSELENPYAREDYTLPNKEAKEMAFDAGAKAQLKRVREHIEGVSKARRTTAKHRVNYITISRQDWESLFEEIE